MLHWLVYIFTLGAVLAVFRLAHAKDCLKGDIVFVLDKSGTVRDAGFEKEKAFVRHVSASFNVSPKNIHIGIMLFDASVYMKLKLSDGTSIKAVEDVLDNGMDFDSIVGGTWTHSALKNLRTKMFSASYGARLDVPHIAIVVTDGQSRRPTKTKKQAELNQLSGIISFAIGVKPDGNEGTYDINELKVIASDDDHVYEVANFEELELITSELAKEACEDVKKTTTPTNKPTEPTTPTSKPPTTTISPITTKTTTVSEASTRPSEPTTFSSPTTTKSTTVSEASTRPSEPTTLSSPTTIISQTTTETTTVTKTTLFSEPTTKLTAKPSTTIVPSTIPKPCIKPTHCVDDDGNQHKLGAIWWRDDCLWKYECKSTETCEPEICEIPFQCERPSICRSVNGSPTCYSKCHLDKHGKITGPVSSTINIWYMVSQKRNKRSGRSTSEDVVDGCIDESGFHHKTGETWLNEDCTRQFECKVINNGTLPEICETTFECHKPGVCEKTACFGQCVRWCIKTDSTNRYDPVVYVNS